MKQCNKMCEEIYSQFLNNKIDVLYDDRDCSIGKKLSDNELIGIPYQLVIGKRDLKNNVVEFKDRINNKSIKMQPDQAINFLFDKFK